MKPLRVLTAAEQVTNYLREQIQRGTWADFMPGMDHLAAELGIGIHTASEALKQLEEEGLLTNQGRRRRRRIIAPQSQAMPGLRVRILLYDHKLFNLLYEIRHALDLAGHDTRFSTKTLEELGMNLKRVANYVNRTPADAWLVEAGSHEILKWFSERNKPALAIFGRFNGLQIAGIKPRHPTAIISAVRRLIELGHRRIVLLARKERRHPAPGIGERTFLEELTSHGIATGSYNLPDWHESASGLRMCLTTMFKHTPPTAILIQTPDVFIHVMQFLMMMGLRVPEDVSLVNMETNENYSWSEPSVAHIDWERSIVVKHAVRWTHQTATGKQNRKQVLINARYVDGGTVGPAKKT